MDLIKTYKIATKTKKRNKKTIQEQQQTKYIQVERATEENKLVVEL
jgi:hypothetical protein